MVRVPGGKLRGHWLEPVLWSSASEKEQPQADTHGHSQNLQSRKALPRRQPAGPHPPPGISLSPKSGKSAETSSTIKPCHSRGSSRVRMDGARGKGADSQPSQRHTGGHTPGHSGSTPHYMWGTRAGLAKRRPSVKQALPSAGLPACPGQQQPGSFPSGPLSYFVCAPAELSSPA